MGGDPKLKSITPEAVEKYILVSVGEGHTKGGINTEIRGLKALYSWGQKKDYVSSNPFAAVELFPAEASDPRPLTPAELERLFQTCPPGSRWYPLIMVYLLTGARLSEVLKPKLTWRDIDFENEILTLPIRKSHTSTEFPLDTVLLEIFRELKANPYTKAHDNKPDDHHYPFPFGHHYISHKIKAILKGAGIDATAHDLRDSFVSHLIHIGYPLEDVSKIAGHSTTQITERYYYKQLEERRRQMLTDLGDHFTGRYSQTNIDTLLKTRPKNVAKTRLTPPSDLPNPAVSEDTHQECKDPALPSRKEDSKPVPRTRFEPTTHGLEGRCSIQLSYRGNLSREIITS